MNSWKRFLLALAVAGCSVAGQAQTIIPKLDQEGRKGDMARLAKETAVKKFETADTDKDDRLSQEELAVGHSYMAANFERLDANKDGYLSWEEYVGHNRWPR